MKRYILALCAMATVSLPMSSRAIDKEEMKKCFEPLAYKIHRCSIENPQNILGSRFPRDFLEKTSTDEQNS